MTCNGAGGSTTKSVTVNVNTTPPTAPTLSINANPASIDENQTTVISWNANNANNCSATGGWSASTATSGSQTVGPLSTNTTYSMTCNGAGGSTTKSVTVNVNATPPTAPTLSINANPASIDENQTTVISWNANNANNCSAHWWLEH